MKTTRLQVTMRTVEPAVTRVIDVPTVTTLPELHQLLQAALGWTDSHLHQFFTADACYGIPDPDAWPQDQRDEAEAELADLGTAFTYVYDFGDNWIHDVEVLGPAAPSRAASTAPVPARRRTAVGRAVTPSCWGR